MKLLKSKTGISRGFSIGGLIVGVISIVIAVIVIPIASTEITAAAGNFSGSENSLLGLIPLLLVVGVLFIALAVAGLRSN